MGFSPETGSPLLDAMAYDRYELSEVDICLPAGQSDQLEALKQIVSVLPCRNLVARIELRNSMGKDVCGMNSSVDSDGVIALQPGQRWESLRENALHQWSHLAYRFFTYEAFLFDRVVELETFGYFSEPEAVLNNEVNWALHLPRCIMGADLELQTFCFQAPLRASVLSMPLMRAVNSETGCTDVEARRFYEMRNAFVVSNAVPLAWRRLVQIIEKSSGGKKQNHADIAFKLLVHAGWLGTALPELTKPVQLKVAYEPFDNKLLERVSGLSQLTEIDVAGTYVENEGALSLENLPALERLSLRKTSIDSAALERLRELPVLVELDLRQTYINDFAYSHLRHLRSLRVLKLSQACFSEQGLASIKRALPLCDVQVEAGSPKETELL